jgi:hypothetical protein
VSTDLSRARSRQSTRALLLLIAVLGVVVAGCQLVDPIDEDVAGATQTAEEQASPDRALPPDGGVPDEDPQAAPGGVPGSAPDDDDLPAGRCSPVDEAAIDAVIGGQLAAFADDDFGAALEFASPGFRESFTPESFGAMITTSFPVPATATGHDLVGCSVVATPSASSAHTSVAAVLVAVTGEAGEQTYQYGLVQLEDGWRIDGAVPVSPPAPGGPII